MNESVDYVIEELQSENAALKQELEAARGDLQANIRILGDFIDELGEDRSVASALVEWRARAEKAEAQLAALCQNDLTAALEYAARELPEGYSIIITVEKDSGYIVLEDRYWHRIESEGYCSVDDTMPQQIRAAVDYAKAQGGE